MLQFIVLGQIPGTSIQINFGLYMLGLALLGTAGLLAFMARQKQQDQRTGDLMQDVIDRTAL